MEKRKYHISYMFDDLVLERILKYCDDKLWLKMRLMNHHIFWIGKRCENRLKKRLKKEIDKNKKLHFLNQMLEGQFNYIMEENSYKIVTSEKRCQRAICLAIFFIGMSSSLVINLSKNINSQISATFLIGCVCGSWYYLYSLI